MEGLDGKQTHKRNRREIEQREIGDLVERIWREHEIVDQGFLEGSSL